MADRLYLLQDTRMGMVLPQYRAGRLLTVYRALAAMQVDESGRCAGYHHTSHVKIQSETGTETKATQ